MFTKRFLTAALGAVVLVAFCAPMAHGSNMGFKLERNLDSVAVESAGTYFVSFPFFRSFQNLATNHDPASGTGGEGTTPDPDNHITALDVLVDWATNGDGDCTDDAEDVCESLEISLVQNLPDPSMTCANGNPGPCVIKIKPRFGGGLEIDGVNDFNIMLDPAMQDPQLPPTRPDENIRGYSVIVATGAAPSVTVGSHNPDIDQWVVPFFNDPASRNDNGFSLPYHTTFTTADELLQAAYSAQPNLDADCDGDTVMDDCTTASDCDEFTLITFDPDPATNPSQQPTVRKIKSTFGCGTEFDNTAFDLTPGNGYGLLIAGGGTDDAVIMPLDHY